MWYTPWATPARIQTPSLADVRELVEITIVHLYSGLWIVRQILELDSVKVHGPNLEQAMFTKEELLEHKSPRDFVRLIRRRIERW